MTHASSECPRVSITIVTYNHADFIVDCLDSIRAQDYPNLEVIVCDDCSPDNTADIIEKYAENYPHFISHFVKHAENIGISRNCNYALSQATGDYVVPFSGDDIMMKNKIKTQVAVMQKNPQAIMSFSNMEWFWSENGRKICNHFGLLQRPSTSLGKVLGDFSIPTPSMMIDWRKAKDLRYRENLRYTNDMLFVIEMMLRGPVIYIPDVLVRYRKHKKSVTMNNYFYEDRVLLLDMLQKELPATDSSALKKYTNIVKYAEIMTLIQNKQKKIAMSKIIAILPVAFTSPKWMARTAAIFINMVR